jgi:transposase
MRIYGEESTVYLYEGVIDMRVSFDRLSSLVKEQIERSVVSGGIYVFFSRCRSRVKILYWDRDGYALWYKRLEAGSFKIEKRASYEEITGIDLSKVLEGMDLSRIKMQKSAEKGSFT